MVTRGGGHEFRIIIQHLFRLDGLAHDTQQGMYATIIHGMSMSHCAATKRGNILRRIFIPFYPKKLKPICPSSSLTSL